MAKSLRGSMIVGYYKKDKEDFADHGHIMTIDDEGLHFEVKTTPYGFVSPDAKVWFQTFQEQDEDLNPIEREYLMTTGYLWTKAFPETEAIFKQGRPQSMELDSDSVSGEWTKSLNHDYEILIVNDAIFSKLCILGDDVEPCFEGASITRPEISANFSLEDSFKNSLYTMMSEFKEVLQGGKKQMDNEKKPISETSEMEPAATYAKEDEDKKKKEDTKAAGEDTSKESEDEGKKSEEEAPAKKEDGKKKEDEKYSLSSTIENAVDTIPAEEYEALKNKYSALEKTVAELTAFKTAAEREKKNSLINEFTMLSNEDKADVVTNIDKYTLDEIESKLSVICFRKKVNFVSTEKDKTENIVETPDEKLITYSLGGLTDSTPDWIKAVDAYSAK